MSRLFGTVELGIIAHWQLPADVFSDTSKQQSNLSEPQLLLRCITYGPAESGIETALRNVLTCMVDSRLICGSRLCALSHLRVWTSKTRQHDPTSTIIPKTVLKHCCGRHTSFVSTHGCQPNWQESRTI